MNDQQSKIWKCLIRTLDNNNEPTEVELEFGDYDDLAQQSFVLKKEYFEELITKIKTVDKYTLTGGLMSITSPEGEDFSKHSFFAILGVDLNNLLLGVLIGELQDSTFKVVGYYPEELNTQFDSNPNIIKNLAILLLKQDDMWQFVNLVAVSPDTEASIA